MYTCYIQSFKILASSCSWASWFECYLVEKTFSHDVAHIWVKSFLLYCFLYRNELEHEKTYRMTGAPSKDSDQPAHLSSLIRVATGHLTKVWSLATRKEHSEYSDQTGWMPSLRYTFPSELNLTFLMPHSQLNTLDGHCDCVINGPDFHWYILAGSNPMWTTCGNPCSGWQILSYKPLSGLWDG